MSLLPLFGAVREDNKPEHAHLQAPPPGMVELLNAKALTFVANSEELFSRAWAEYLKQGRGCIFVRYDSREDMEECAAKNQYKMRYAELVDMLAINYPPAHKLIKQYNAQIEFVLVIGVACPELRGAMVFASSLLPRTAQYRLHDAARALDQFEQTGGRHLDALPLKPVRMCCAFRTALSMSQCDHSDDE